MTTLTTVTDQPGQNVEDRQQIQQLTQQWVKLWSLKDKYALNDNVRKILIHKLEKS
ncbi:hypothetical protein GS682_28915 [Nostoc sp. B(2019)]|nr:hypothetical protein [Nostoc sp. B(2019)]